MAAREDFNKWYQNYTFENRGHGPTISDQIAHLCQIIDSRQRLNQTYLNLLQNERQRWSDIRRYAQATEDLVLSEALDKISIDFVERGQGLVIAEN